MRVPLKFKIAIGVKEGKLICKEVLGYNVPLPYGSSLKVFSCNLIGGWQVIDQKTGMCLSGTVLHESENDAIDEFVKHVNAAKSISDYVESVKEQMNKQLEESKQNAEPTVIASDGDTIGRKGRSARPKK